MMLRRLRLVLRPWLLQSAFTEIEIAKMKVGNVVFSLAEKKGNELPCVAATFLKIRTPKMKKARKAENMHLKSRKPEFLFIFLFLYTLPMGLLVHFTMAAAIDDGNIHFNLTDFTPNMPHIQFEADTTASGGQIQLTTNQRNKPLNGSVGRATYYQPMHLWDNSSRKPLQISPLIFLSPSIP
ncbi:hypothetical protein PVK06_012949 [Gossypium arboreum]|uniref:Legume lectin domain-containing protein n=1 Tax=Gossypium arboreum TaxID=29729 RepID=A0ABR0QDP1_GOSAR|nr:hypothetical protein PVK06_012949 [Gossypium arboreum]